MTRSQNSEDSLEAQLELLRTASTADSAKRVQRGIRQRARWQRRQVTVASFGACVAAIGTLHFLQLRDPFVYFTLALTTLLLIVVAWQSAQQAAKLAVLKTGASLLANWQAELRQQLGYTLIAPLFALLFASLTAWVIWQHGMLSYKPYLFLATTAAVIVYAAYQILVVRLALRSELEMLDQHE